MCTHAVYCAKRPVKGWRGVIYTHCVNWSLSGGGGLDTQCVYWSVGKVSDVHIVIDSPEQ